MLFSDPTLNSIVSIVLIVVGVAVVVLVLKFLGKGLMKLVIGLVLNTVLGFIVLLALNYFFGITFQYSMAEIVALILFGLPAVGTFILLKLVGGVALVALL